MSKYILIDIEGEYLTFRQASEKYSLAEQTIRSRFYSGKRGKDLVRPTNKGNIFTYNNGYYEMELRDMKGKLIGHTLISEQDKPYIEKYTWCLGNTGYVLSSINGKIVLLHRFLLSPGKDQIVDHINRNRLDNRRCNLRLGDYTLNAQNISVAKNNSSGITGVYLNKKLNRWAARICVNYKTIYLGSFAKIEDAIKVRKDAEKRYFSCGEVY